jgi:tetratricopeptide (TPR) repeat protein
LNYPRAKRARRLNTVWFVLALLPALASVVLITLLAQRLAINGPDLLSGASVIAQVGIGLASIIAGREILNDLILKGVTASWQGKLTFALASLFLFVVVVFYFLAPPGAALIYHVFGERAIKSGNAAEAELYLESAARLNPDPHAASLLEVGCLYQTLGAPDRAQTVFERVLEADSRLLLARYHLAQLYVDRGKYDQALQLAEDGLNLLDTGREDMAHGDYSFLPGVNTEAKADEMEYLMRLARGRAYLESNAPEQAKTNLRDAEALFDQIQTASAALHISADALNRFNLACGPNDDRRPFILSTYLDLHYYLARTYDALCTDEATVVAAQDEWRLIRNGQPSNSRQASWRDDAVRRLSSGQTCQTNYGLTVSNVSDSLTTTPLPPP